MKFLFSIFLVIATAVAATLAHQTLPPLGVIFGITSTYLALWWLGRFYGKRIYKFWALVAWILVIGRAGSFGVGKELLIQGDNPGSALLLLGFIAGVLALLRSV